VFFQGVCLSLTFFSAILAARLLGPVGLGQYTYALSIIGILSIIASLGLPTTITRFLSIYQSNHEWCLFKGLLRRSNQFISLFGFFLAFCLIIILYFFRDGDLIFLYFFASPIVILLPLTNIRQKALQSLHHAVSSQLPEQIIKHSFFILISAYLFFLCDKESVSPSKLMFFWFIANVSAFSFASFLIHKHSPNELQHAKLRYNTKHWFLVSIPFLLADSIGIIYSATDIIMIGIFRSDSEVGIYQVASKTAGLMLVFLSASNWYLAPFFAKLHFEKKHLELQNIVTRTIRIVFFISILAYFLFIFYGNQFLYLFFGKVYSQAYSVLLILGFSKIFDIACGPVINLLSMTGGQRFIAWVISLSALLNVLGCIILLPCYGIIGAAISTTFVIIISNLILTLIVKSHLGIGSSIFG
jgi:O-antigen/teichoic acid export membrane protein